MNVDFRNVVDMAQFCAELVRQGIAFYAGEHSGGYRVILTGY
jgi:hypothetical protein